MDIGGSTHHIAGPARPGALRKETSFVTNFPIEVAPDQPLARLFAVSPTLAGRPLQDANIGERCRTRGGDTVPGLPGVRPRAARARDGRAGASKVGAQAPPPSQLGAFANNIDQ